jgi:hypothetical protein
MTAKVLSPQAMCEVLDALADGFTIKEAAESVGASEGAFWTWKHKSRVAEQECDFTEFYISWHGRRNFFHELCPVAQQPARTPLPVKAIDDGELFEKEPPPKATGPFPPMSELRMDLMQKLREARENPNRITRPQGHVHIERDQPDDGARERINNPSNQAGLPTHAADAPRAAAPVDYSRRTVSAPRPVRVDTGGIGYGAPPKGGHRVA